MTDLKFAPGDEREKIDDQMLLLSSSFRMRVCLFIILFFFLVQQQQQRFLTLLTCPIWHRDKNEDKEVDTLNKLAVL
jgi:hypothetical protein